eukprot:78765-Pyramimonas_sp.AAC.1
MHRCSPEPSRDRVEGGLRQSASSRAAVAAGSAPGLGILTCRVPFAPRRRPPSRRRVARQGERWHPPRC